MTRKGGCKTKFCWGRYGNNRGKTGTRKLEKKDPRAGKIKNSR